MSHKPHFYDGDRNFTPVDTRHIVRVNDSPIVETCGCAVGINDALGESVALVIEVGHIGIARRWAHSKCTAGSVGVVSIGMHTYHDFSAVVRSK